jgi:hypothetical protein
MTGKVVILICLVAFFFVALGLHQHTFGARCSELYKGDAAKMEKCVELLATSKAQTLYDVQKWFSNNK